MSNRSRGRVALFLVLTVIVVWALTEAVSTFVFVDLAQRVEALEQAAGVGQER